MKTFQSMVEERAKDNMSRYRGTEALIKAVTAKEKARNELILEYAAQNAGAMEALIEGTACVLPLEFDVCYEGICNDTAKLRELIYVGSSNYFKMPLEDKRLDGAKQ